MMKPKTGTHWSIRQIAEETGVSKSTVHRIFSVLRTNCATRSSLIGRGRPGRNSSSVGTHPANVAAGIGLRRGSDTRDYRRHGTTTLFAALDTANGKVLTQCRPRHRHQEYLGFLREIEKNVPKNLEVHVIVDNYATHKHLRVRRWVRRTATIPCALHSHLCLLAQSGEIWFNRITQQAIRRGTFSSVKDLVEKIDHFVQNSNRRAQPFVWTATADSIFAYVNVFTGQHTS